jgi:hypothetical protein
MKKFAIIAAMPVLVVFSLTAPTTAQAGNDGAVAAGVAGGLIGGLALGSALAPRPNYGPPPGYGYPDYGPASAYGYPNHCYWARGRAYWDSYRGVWVRPRMRVCN